MPYDTIFSTTEKVHSFMENTPTGSNSYVADVIVKNTENGDER